MFSIDVTSNKEYYIILKNDKEFCRISKASNKLKEIMDFFKITIVK